MSGFITAFLANYPGEKDWECIVDGCGYCSLLNDTLNVCADYSPSRKITVFGGHWYQVRPRVSLEAPTEDQVYQWVENDPCAFSRMMAARRRRKQQWEDRFKAIDAEYEKHGTNWATVTFRLPDQTEQTVSQIVGLRKWQALLPLATTYMQKSLPKGTKLALFRVETGLTKKQIAKREKAQLKLAA